MKLNKTIIIGINISDCGSTGIIMKNCLEYASKNGNYDYCALTYDGGHFDNSLSYTPKNKIFQRLYNRLFKISINYPDGFYFKANTKRVIKQIKRLSSKYNKTFVHIHNIHSSFLDIKTLFDFLSLNKDIHVFYTLHDCWSFTGGCCCFDYNKCYKWENGCNECDFGFDSLKIATCKQWEIKRELMTSIKDQLTLVTVSQWMIDNLNSSFFKGFDVVLNNGECNIANTPDVDLNLKKSLGIDNKKVLICVADYWSEWKGASYVGFLAKKLPKDYVILVIGRHFTYKRDNIINITKVDNSLLPNYYAIADCYVSTTQDDNFPLVLMEAQICGVPIVGFGHGGTKEQITQKSGIMVGEENDVDKLLHAVIHVVEDKPFIKSDIINSGMRFAKFAHAKRMLNIYEKYN